MENEKKNEKVTVTQALAKPERWPHSCEKCRFLGMLLGAEGKHLDLYVCGERERLMIPGVVARYGGEDASFAWGRVQDWGERRHRQLQRFASATRVDWQPGPRDIRDAEVLAALELEHVQLEIFNMTLR